MISVFFGNDVIGVRTKAFDFVHSLTEEGSGITHVTPDHYEEGMIADVAEGASLFGGMQVCVIDTPSEDQAMYVSVVERLEMMKTSPHHFVLIESTLTAPEKKKFEAHATHFEELTAEKKERFNTFLLTDAFLRRDKKSLWILLQEAWGAGISNEEIIGVLLWQVKILRLVEKTKSAEESGQKPFVYQKAKRALSSFKKGELDSISRELLIIYHDGHLGKHDTGLALEKWVLSL